MATSDFNQIALSEIDDDMFNVVLQDEDEQYDIGAEPKFAIRGIQSDGEGPLVDQMMAGNHHHVQCKMVEVCHGTTISNGPPASLIVFRFEFQPFGIKKRFKWVEATMIFHPEEGSTNGPEIIDISPSKEYTFDHSEKVLVKGHQATAAVAVGLDVAKATPSYTWHATETATIKEHGTIVGKSYSTQLKGTDRKVNTVKWGLYENSETGNGIPIVMQTAVLVKRDISSKNLGGEMFSAELVIKGKMNISDEVREKATLFGRATKNARKIFNREESKMVLIEDRENLQKENLERFQELIMRQDWDEKKKLTESNKPLRWSPKRLTQFRFGRLEYQLEIHHRRI